MTKEEKIAAFNPNSAGLRDSNLFGLPFTADEADVVIIPVPWEATVSYGSGAADGPVHVLETSVQVDLYHEDFPALWKAGIAMTAVPEDLRALSRQTREKASAIIASWESGTDPHDSEAGRALLAEINDACAQMNQWVEAQADHWFAKGKCVGLLGGDHSTPFGLFRAQAKRHEAFGILHIDAHMDLRIAYEGFQWSHASIMYNALSIPQISRIVQAGIRDRCQEETDVADGSQGRVTVFSDMRLRREQFAGDTWDRQCDALIAQLPQKVHISFDIDGLDPTLCPDTGTPVPGGFSYAEATHLLSKVRQSGREIIGFDLVEVAPGDTDWNGNVGARLLFHLCGVLASSAGRI